MIWLSVGYDDGVWLLHLVSASSAVQPVLSSAAAGEDVAQYNVNVALYLYLLSIAYYMLQPIGF